MLHAILWCPSVNSFKFRTCVYTTPGGECLKHFCSKLVPKACIALNSKELESNRGVERVTWNTKLTPRMKASSAYISQVSSKRQQARKHTSRNLRLLSELRLVTLKRHGSNWDQRPNRYNHNLTGWKKTAIKIPSFDVTKWDYEGIWSSWNSQPSLFIV